MYGTPHSLATMNGMGGDVDASGTIDPANLSSSGMSLYHSIALLRALSPFVTLSPSGSRRLVRSLLPRRDGYLSRPRATGS